MSPSPVSSLCCDFVCARAYLPFFPATRRLRRRHNDTTTTVVAATTVSTSTYCSPINVLNRKSYLERYLVFPRFIVPGRAHAREREIVYACTFSYSVFVRVRVACVREFFSALNALPRVIVGETKATRMLKFIRGKGQQPTAERQKLQKDLFAFRKVSNST